MIDTKCLDSSAWLAYFFQESLEVKDIVESGETVITSTLSLFEIKKRLLTLKKNPEPALKLVKERSNLVAPGLIISEKAAEMAIEKKLAAIDALIYATCRLSGAELITGDNDFRDLEKVRIIT